MQNEALFMIEMRIEYYGSWISVHADAFVLSSFFLVGTCETERTMVAVLAL
jgi:hypothetical protein